MKNYLYTIALLSFITAYVTQGLKAEEDVFDLDPFVVEAKNVGYQARNSLSATKFEIAVKEVPITISSLTGEFLEDTYSESLEDAVRFSAAITNGPRVSSEESGSFYIRGLRTLRSKRNGVIQLFTQDMTNVQKVEVVKGPMSLLYGQVEPGGLINYLTLNALDEFRTTFKVTGGSYGHFRAQLNHTGPIFEGREDGQGRLLYRIDGSYREDQGWRDNTEDQRSFVSGLLEYKPTAGSTVEIQWDFLNQNSFNSSPLPKINKRWFGIFSDLIASLPEDQLVGLATMASQDPYASYDYLILSTPNGDFYRADNSEPRIWDGYAEHWNWKLNPAPANAFNDVDMHTVSLEYRQKLWGEGWFAKLYAVHNKINRTSVWGQPWGVGISGEAGPGYSWNFWDRFNDDTAIQLEVTGKWNLGPFENQTIIGLEHLNDNYEAFLAVGGFNNVVRPEIAAIINANRSSNPYFRESVNYRVLGAYEVDLDQELAQNSDQEKITNAAFISNVARFLNGRGLVMGGLRFDDISIKEFRTNDQTGEREEVSDFAETSVSPQLGVSFSPVEPISVYASYSESFVPQSGTTPVLKSNEDLALELPLPAASRDLTDDVAKLPLTGSGYEFGIKFDAMEEKISGTVSYWKTELSGVEKTYFVTVPGFQTAQGTPQTALVGSQNNGREVSGVETELFIRPMDGLQFVVTYAYIDSQELLASTVSGIRGDQNVTLSIPSVSVPLHQAGLWTKYSFQDGFFDGFSIGGGFRWMDERYGSYSLRSDNPAAAGFVGDSESVEDRILLDANITWDLLLSYKFERGSLEYAFQINIKNLTDERFIEPGGMPNDPMRAYASLEVKF